MARLRRFILAALAIAATAASALAAPGPAAAAPVPLLGSRESGTTSYVGGALVYTGYAYNDRGPNETDGVVPGGQAEYPSGLSNTANLIQLQLGLVRGGLQLGATLETLTNPSVPMVGIGFDTDRNASTGAPTVPGGAWHNSAPLGLEYFVTVSQHGGVLLRWAAGAWHTVGTFAATVDPGTNQLTTVVPAKLLPTPRRSSWDVVGVAGLAGSGSSWLDGTGSIYDLAFVHAEDPCTDVVCLAKVGMGLGTAGTGTTAGSPPEWQDGRQGAILAGQSPPAPAVGQMSFAAMRARYTTPITQPGPGFHTFVYQSALRLPEGVSYDATDGPTYLGPYQPYLTYVPAGLPSPAPAVLFLHGGGQNHLMNAFNFVSSGSTLDSVTTGVFSWRAITVFPLGRKLAVATNQVYNGISEQDVLDALSDAERHYRIDTNRVAVYGNSVGGGGAFHFAELYPDLFAGAMSSSAFDNEGLPQNLLDLPLRYIEGSADFAGNAAYASETSAEFDTLDDEDFRWFEVTRHTHEYMPGLSSCLVQEMLDRGRVAVPARVRYAVNPIEATLDPATGLDLHHDHAYWVSGIVPAGQSLTTVDATRLTTPMQTTRAQTTDTVGDNILAGADFCGPNPAVKSDDTWRVHSITLTPGPPSPAANGVRITLTGVAAVTLDLGRAGVERSRPIILDVTTNHQVALTLQDGWRPGETVTPTIDGTTTATVQESAGAVPLTVAPGHHTLSLRTSTRRR